MKGGRESLLAPITGSGVPTEASVEAVVVTEVLAVGAEMAP